MKILEKHKCLKDYSRLYKNKNHIHNYRINCKKLLSFAIFLNILDIIVLEVLQMHHLSTIETDEALENLLHLRRTAVPTTARPSLLRHLVFVYQ